MTVCASSRSKPRATIAALPSNFQQTRSPLLRWYSGKAIKLFPMLSSCQSIWAQSCRDTSCLSWTGSQKRCKARFGTSSYQRTLPSTTATSGIECTAMQLCDRFTWTSSLATSRVSSKGSFQLWRRVLQTTHTFFARFRQMIRFTNACYCIRRASCRRTPCP